jgi:FKBP-type peptidyl-prolyl cis-trans isomerase SlyD
METVVADKWVTMKYTMISLLPDGSKKEHPEEKISFIFGVDRQVPSLETAVGGLQVGECGKVDIPASELYGEHDASLIKEIPKKGMIRQRLKAGQFYRQMKMGSLISFKVLEVKPQTVVADFNRPMAGIRVSMNYEIQDIRDASAEEVDSAMEAQVRKSIGCS